MAKQGQANRGERVAQYLPRSLVDGGEDTNGRSTCRCTPRLFLPETAAWFAAGGAVTVIFSGSLAALASHAGLVEVLTIGMLVPCFTWVVQLGASAFALAPSKRRLYWGDLGRICLIGSDRSLACAAIANLCLSRAPLWISAANVLLSGAIMRCGSVPPVRSARNRRRLAAQLVPDHHREHAALLWSSWKWW